MLKRPENFLKEVRVSEKDTQEERENEIPRTYEGLNARRVSDVFSYQENIFLNFYLASQVSGKDLSKFSIGTFSLL